MDLWRISLFSLDKWRCVIRIWEKICFCIGKSIHCECEKEKKAQSERRREAENKMNNIKDFDDDGECLHWIWFANFHSKNSNETSTEIFSMHAKVSIHFCFAVFVDYHIYAVLCTVQALYIDISALYATATTRISVSRRSGGIAFFVRDVSRSVCSCELVSGEMFLFDSSTFWLSFVFFRILNLEILFLEFRMSAHIIFTVM